jgi:hypothetical protein
MLPVLLGMVISSFAPWTRRKAPALNGDRSISRSMCDHGAGPGPATIYGSASGA